MIQIFQQIKCTFHSIMEKICKYLDLTMLNNPCFKGNAVFGPVRSRRLGYSLGINTMKCKMCTYDCVYCQIGQTPCRSTCRESCISAYELYCVVRKKLDLLSEQKVPIDYITFVTIGEPTLDDNLAQKIKLLREFGYKIAVITNASLLWNDKVQEDLLFADYVSIKIDTVNENTWQTLNRPHTRLRLQSILDGIERFSKRYQGVLTTETMIVKGMNDTIPDIEAIGVFLNRLTRTKSYFTIPTRPPSESFVVPPDQQVLSQISDFITHNLSTVEMLFTSDMDDFYGAGELENELLATLSAQPMKEEAVVKFIAGKGGTIDTLQHLVESKRILEMMFEGNKFYTHTNLYNYSDHLTKNEVTP
jgi:wyosine [tRNA(Phe)-imidazoG37] synthetase (radical SAM superfamily)